MKPVRDPDPIFSAWLDEGPTALPDVTRRAIVAALPTTNQRRRPIWAPWRFSPMSAPLRAALAVLIATVVIGGGIYLLGPRGSGPGVDVTPSPSPSATPTSPSPTPSTSPIARLRDGLLEPGPYRYEGISVRVIITVPAGWEGGSWSVSHAPGRELPDGANLLFLHPTVVFSDPCEPELSSEGVGETVADLVSAMTDLPNVTDVAQEDVTISGFSGTHVSFVVDTEGIDCVMGLYGQSSFIRAADNGQHENLWILDVAGTRLVIDSATYPETSAAVRAEVLAMVDTLVIEPID